MKKVILLLCLVIAGTTANAQLFKSKKQSEESYTIGANGQIVKKKGLFDRKPKAAINEKYLAGACPEIKGKIQWDKVVNVPNASADEIYKKALAFVEAYCKKNTVEENNKTKALSSKVIAADAESKQIGARIQELLVFENKLLSLDLATLNYQLVVNAADGRCIVSMRHITYTYEEDRSGGTFPAEDMISDAQALAKDGKSFQLGGSEKFRTKTIDAKDLFFQKFEEALKK